MARYFRLEEAQELLGAIELALRDALFHKAELQSAQSQISGLMQMIHQAGGMQFDPQKVLRLRAERDRVAGQLKDDLDKIQESGALVKDLDIGLIDFLTFYEGQEVCLCWKLGETGITFWHGTEEGFGGRKPIDAHFIANHTTSEPG